MDLISCLFMQILTLPSECHGTGTVFRLQPHFHVLGWQEWCSVWSSAAASHLLRGLTCWVQRWCSALLGCNKWWLGVTGNTLTSHTDSWFSSAHLPACKSAQFLKYSEYWEYSVDAHRAPTTIPCSKSLKSPFLLIVTLCSNFSKFPCPHLHEWTSNWIKWPVVHPTWHYL